MTFATWIKQQLRFIDEMEAFPERDLQAYEDFRSIVAEASKRAAAAGIPAGVAACQIRSGPIAPNIAREVLAKCLAACPGSTELTPPQVAKRFGVKPETVIHWIRAGKLRAINVAKPGKRPRWRIGEEMLKEFGNVKRTVKAAEQHSRIPLVPFTRY
jgi:excisionase family DNA binding protein